MPDRRVHPLLWATLLAGALLLLPLLWLEPLGTAGALLGSVVLAALGLVAVERRRDPGRPAVLPPSIVWRSLRPGL